MQNSVFELEHAVNIGCLISTHTFFHSISSEWRYTDDGQKTEEISRKRTEAGGCRNLSVNGCAAAVLFLFTQKEGSRDSGFSWREAYKEQK